MAVAQIQFPTPQAYSGGADFSPLAQLPQIYQKAQQERMQQAALVQLGQDPNANAQTLLQSGVPSLAQLGLNMQQKELERRREDARYSVTDARANEQLRFQREQATRAQADWEEKAANEAAAAKSIGGLLPGQAPAAAPSPFPAVGAPAASVSPAAVQQPLVQPDGQASPIDPSQVAATTTAAPPSIVDRVANNLTSGAPAATAGVSREQIAELYRNPLTRPLATAFLQNQMNPGTWEVEKTEDGRLIAVNKKTLQTKDLTPGGEGGSSKQEREVAGYFKAGKALNMTDDEARAYAANKGKTPGEETLKPAQQKRVDALTDQQRVSERVLDNLKQLRVASKGAWGFTGAGPASLAAATVLPNSLATASGAVDTQDLINAAHMNVTNVAKATFGARVTNLDVNLLKDLESSANQPDIVRQKIYDRAEKVFSKIAQEDAVEAEGIRNKTWYKPGGGGGPRTTAPGGATTPSLTWSIVPGH